MPLFLVGCSNVDVDELRKSIDVSNNRTELILEDYNNAKFKATKLFEEIGKYIDGSVTDLKVDGVSNDFLSDVKVLVDECKAKILSIYEDEKLFNEEKGYEVLTLSEFIKKSSKSYYFLNEEQGTLEQDILFNLPYGVVRGIEVEWLGGDIIGSKAYANS